MHKIKKSKQSQKRNKKQKSKQSQKSNIQEKHLDKNELLENVVNGEITEEQKADLNYMIEEEKVARDVYAALAKTSKERIFTNIAAAEQKHMDAVRSLFTKYGLEVPVSLNDAGQFDNEALQIMYDDLVTQGQNSRVDALEVGVIIEEADIADLQSILDAGVPSDFATVYENLLKGSYNHLKAFNKVLTK